jgi:hypothetical protein
MYSTLCRLALPPGSADFSVLDIEGEYYCMAKNLDCAPYFPALVQSAELAYPAMLQVL